MITGLGWILLLIAGVFIIWNSRRHKMADREIRKAILTQSTVRCTLMHLHAAPLLRLVNEVLQREGQLSRNCHAHETGLKELAKQFDVTLASNETLMVENFQLKNDPLRQQCEQLTKELEIANENRKALAIENERLLHEALLRNTEVTGVIRTVNDALEALEHCRKATARYDRRLVPRRLRSLPDPLSADSATTQEPLS